MAVYAYLWSDEQGESVDKVQQHGLTCQDWQYVFENYQLEEVSRSSDRLIRIATMPDGRRLCVVFEWIEVEWCVLPITGFELKDKP